MSAFPSLLGAKEKCSPQLRNGALDPNRTLAGADDCVAARIWEKVAGAGVDRRAPPRIIVE